MSQPVNLFVELHSGRKNTTETVSLSFPAIPAAFAEIKAVIEDTFSIPSHSQTVMIHGNEVQDCTPSSLYMQSGDTLRIEFPGKCDCTEVKAVIKWLTECISAIKNIKNLKTEREINFMFEQSISLFANYDVLQSLTDLFALRSDDVNLLNAAYFDHLGGLELLVKSHDEVRSLRDNELFQHLHSFSESLECNYCLAFSTFASSPSNRRRAAQCGGLDRCIKTFVTANAEDSRAIKMVEASLFGISNISDIPENQCYISKQKNVIEQVMTLIATPQCYSNRRVITALCLLVCLAQSKETHLNLLQPDIMERLFVSIESREQSLHVRRNLRFQLLICYVGVMLAQMILGSITLLQEFPSSIVMKMEKMMEEVLTFDPLEIGKYENQIGIIWGSFLPLLFLYEPQYISSSKSSTCDFSHLSQLATDVLLHSLQSTLWREEHIKVIKDEGLLDYLIILPWFVPPSSKERARSLIQNVTKVQLIQPPSLCTLCKGNLAKLGHGLNILINMTSVSELLSKLM